MSKKIAKGKFEELVDCIDLHWVPVVLKEDKQVVYKQHSFPNCNDEATRINTIKSKLIFSEYHNCYIIDEQSNNSLINFSRKNIIKMKERHRVWYI